MSQIQREKSTIYVETFRLPGNAPGVYIHHSRGEACLIHEMTVTQALAMAEKLIAAVKKINGVTA
jgi:hypothetical protein